MAKETVRLFFPGPEDLRVSIFEIQGANSLDGTKVVRLSIGTGIHIALAPKMALEIARVMANAAIQIEQDLPEDEGDAPEGMDA